MNSEVRQAISDLLDLSASASGCRWMAVFADHTPELVVHPPEKQEEIGPYLEARKESLSRAADGPVDPGTLVPVMEPGAVEDFNRGLETQSKQRSLLLEVARQISNGVVVTDEGGRITWVNRGFEVISGYRLDEVLGEKPGTLLQCEETKADLQRFRKTLDSTLDCVFMFDADSLEFFYVNRGAVNQLGYSRKELLKMHPFDIKPQYSEASFREMVSPLVSGQVPRLNVQTLHRHKDGHDIPVDVSLQYVKLKGDPPRFITIVRDISDQQRHQSEIEHLAYFDPLTNLPNRRLIWSKLESSLKTSAKSGCFGAILLSDLDDFKNINDTLGHLHGDDFLVEISGRFSAVLGEEKSLSRLGGDEFLVVMNTPHQDRNRAIREVTETAQQLLNAAVQTTATLGSAIGGGVHQHWHRPV